MRPDQQQTYGAIVHLVMAGWYPLCVLFFVMMKPPRAVATGLVTGFLLLPNVSYQIPGIPDYDKSVAIAAGITVAAVLFDFNRLMTYRPRAVDLPMAVLCVSPLLSALVNGDGAYLGASNSFTFLIKWGLPWILGRIYFSDFGALRILAVVVIVGALVYALPALYEVKMSPRLHKDFYGVALKSFKHAQRGALWRPNVFIAHGLAYGLFNALAALFAFALWYSKSKRDLLGVPMIVIVLILSGMAVAAQSTNAQLMLILGATALVCAQRFGWAFPVLLLVCAPPSYIFVRQGLRWDGEELVAVAESVFGRNRAVSLNVRLTNEAELRDRVLARPWFGYNDFRQFTGNTDTKHAATVDSIWLLYLGLYGLVALAGLHGSQLIAGFLLYRKVPPRYWTHPALAPMATAAICSVLMAMDGLLNALDIAAIMAGAAGAAHLIGTREGRAKWMQA